MEIGNLNVEYVEPTELAGKTVVIKPLKKMHYGEPYNCKITTVGSKIGNEYSLMLTLANAFNDKRLIFIEYIIKNIDKHNIIDIDFNRLSKELNKNLTSIYRWIRELIKEDFIVKVSKNKFMVNPQIVINYRRTKNEDLPDLVEQYRIYKMEKE